MTIEKWTVKDVLCHIAFWYNYYAQNHSSLVAGTKPYIFTSNVKLFHIRCGKKGFTLFTLKLLKGGMKRRRAQISRGEVELLA